jgi:hypothetical protein
MQAIKLQLRAALQSEGPQNTKKYVLIYLDLFIDLF